MCAMLLLALGGATAAAALVDSASAACAYGISNETLVEAAGTMLREWPVLYTHNAATGYLLDDGSNVVGVGDLESVSKAIVLAFAKNQAVPLRDQLDCGARGLNLRPQVYEEELVMHHGDAVVLVPFSKALADVKAWVAENPGEFVVVSVTHCAGANCTARAKADLGEASVRYIEQCSELDSLTVAAARRDGIVAVAEACIEPNYDQSVVCYVPDSGSRLLGADGRALADLLRAAAAEAGPRSLQGTAACSRKDEAPFRLLKGHLETVSAEALDASKLTHLNAHWQYNTAQIVSALGAGSTILKDSDSSDVNAWVASLVAGGSVRNINLLQVDNVCNAGCDLQLALAVSAKRNGLATFDEPPSVVPPAGTARRTWAAASAALALAAVHA